jgi:hypothetical protein
VLFLKSNNRLPGVVSEEPAIRAYLSLFGLFFAVVSLSEIYFLLNFFGFISVQHCFFLDLLQLVECLVLCVILLPGSFHLELETKYV